MPPSQLRHSLGAAVLLQIAYGWEPGDASRVIRRFKDAVTPGRKVVLWVRVSHSTQSAKGQTRRLRKAVERAGGIVVAVIVETVTGRRCETEFGDRWGKLCRAGRVARFHDAVLVAESTDRLVRHSDFHPTLRSDLRASERDLDGLADVLHGVELATLIHPNRSARYVRSVQTKRGRRPAGRPPKPKRPKTYRTRADAATRKRAVELRRRGMKFEDIAAEVGYPLKTVAGWCSREGV